MNNIHEVRIYTSSQYDTVLVKVLNDLLLVSDQVYVSLFMLLVLSAAFDITGHTILHDRLENVVGVKSPLLAQVLFENHYQFVDINGDFSIHFI